MANKLNTVEETYFDDEVYTGPEVPTAEMIDMARGFDLKLLFHPRSHWSIDKKIEVAATWIQVGSSLKTSKITNVPASTIREWTRKAVWWDDTVEKCRLVLDEKIAATLTQALYKGSQILLDQIEHGHLVHVETQEWVERHDKDGKSTQDPDEEVKVINRKRKVYEVHPISGTNLSTMVATIYDKLALMRGKPTSRSETVDGTHNILQRLEQVIEEKYEEKMVDVVETQNPEEKTED